MIQLVAAGASQPPGGAAYTLLLLAHVAAAVVGFGALLVTGIQAARARRGPSARSADAVRRYFRPGVNWAGRVLYLVPVLGFALLAASKGDFDASDTFVVSGLAMWAAASIAAELVVWPAERRIQDQVSSGWELTPSLDSDCVKVQLTTLFLSGVFVAAVVIMVAKP
jgi:hypothetical protein